MTNLVLQTLQSVSEQLGDPYAFGFKINDGNGNVQERTEKSDGKGGKIGSYAYLDPNGVYQKVSYIADELGFRILPNGHDHASSSSSRHSQVIRTPESPAAEDLRTHKLVSQFPPPPSSRHFNRFPPNMLAPYTIYDQNEVNSHHRKFYDPMYEKKYEMKGSENKAFYESPPSPFDASSSPYAPQTQTLTPHTPQNLPPQSYATLPQQYQPQQYQPQQYQPQNPPRSYNYPDYIAKSPSIVDLPQPPRYRKIPKYQMPEGFPVTTSKYVSDGLKANPHFKSYLPRAVFKESTAKPFKKWKRINPNDEKQKEWYAKITRSASENDLDWLQTGSWRDKLDDSSSSESLDSSSVRTPKPPATTPLPTRSSIVPWFTPGTRPTAATLISKPIIGDDPIIERRSERRIYTGRQQEPEPEESDKPKVLLRDQSAQIPLHPYLAFNRSKGISFSKMIPRVHYATVNKNPEPSTNFDQSFNEILSRRRDTVNDDTEKDDLLTETSSGQEDKKEDEKSQIDKPASYEPPLDSKTETVLGKWQARIWPPPSRH